MSEYYHNGSVVFDRLLTDTEKERIFSLITGEPKKGGTYGMDCRYKDLSFGVFKPTRDAAGTSTLEFEDYVTGRSGIGDALEDLLEFCKNEGIGVDETSTFVTFIGDDDGGYLIAGGDVVYLDRDDVGVHNAYTDSLLAELRSRGEIRKVLEAVSVEDLENELRSRRNQGEPDHVYVVSSLRKYENDEIYFGADTVFRTLEDAVRDVEDSIREVYRDFQIDEADAFKLGTSGDSQYYRLEWPGHEFAWNINRITIQK